MINGGFLGQLEKGDQLFEHLCLHYEDLFDKEGNIKHFDMRPNYTTMWDYYEQVNEQYGKDVHNLIIPWIHEEKQSGRLFNKLFWKPFRTPDNYHHMYYGYRKLFMFHNYYFQLVLVNDRDNIDGVFQKYVCFEVALYGWKNNVTGTLETLNNVTVLDDMMMPEHDWERIC